MSGRPADYPVLDEPFLDDALLALLAPIPGPDPCGVSVRAESLFTDIRLAREEDDPSLPMRQWERPLEKADWSHIEALCSETLRARSKDLQLAAWLAEAWARQGAGLAGLARGLLLLRELVVRYWAGLHPRIDPPEEGGGCEARIAPLEWLGDSTAHTLRVHVSLFPMAQRKSASVSLADWENLISHELSGVPQEAAALRDGKEPPLSREAIVENVARHHPEVVRQRLAHVREARAYLAALVDLLKGHLGPEAPNLRKLGAVLETLERVLMQVVVALPTRQETQDATQTAQHEEDNMPAADSGAPDSREGVDDALPPSEPVGPVSTGGWRNREEAYHTLEALARYLSAIEPHSPTPYLIHRAVRWGRLPLPDLMAEIMQEEGDLNRLVQLLGFSR